MARKNYLSKKQVIMIDDFMKNYLGKVNYTGDLTHRDMCIYLEEYFGIYLKKVRFKDAKVEKVLTGEHVVVKDHENLTKIYENPMYSLSMLQAELNSKKHKDMIKKKRKQTLDKLGLVEAGNEVIEKKEIEQEEYRFEKENRQKQFVISKNIYYRKRHY